MLAYTYVEPGRFALVEKPRPVLEGDRDAVVRVTLSSICTSDLHILHGSVPRAVPGLPWGTRWWAWWRNWAAPSPACTRRPGGRQCGDLLRRLLFLPPRLGE